MSYASTPRPRSSRARSGLRSRAGVLLATLALAALAACSSGGPTAPSVSASTAPDSSAAPVAADAAAAIAALPDEVKGNYDGYETFTTIHTDPLASYTPPDKPWKFCESTTDVSNSWSQGTQDELKKLIGQLQSQGVADSDFPIVVSNNNVAVQISQTNSLVNEGCDVIIAVPGSPTALCPAISNALSHNVVYLTDDTPIDCEDAINVSLNSYQTMYESAIEVLKAADNKGNFLLLSGIPGAVNSKVKGDAVTAAMATAPDAVLSGTIAGNFSSSVAQTATAQFLGTHPEQIDGLFDIGGMALGGELALEQAGRSYALVNTYTASCAEVAFQQANPDKVAVALDQGPGPAAYETVQVALRILSGQKPTMNAIFYPIPGPTADSIDQWFTSDMTIKSTCYADAPNGPIVEDGYFDALFTGGQPVGITVTP